MLKVALTGGIACGKSLVGLYLSELGADVSDADTLARAVMQPGGAAYQGVVKFFGRGVVDRRTGAIDRKRLARRVFADSAELARLDALVHPHVRRSWLAWLRSRSRRTRVAVVMIPLLFEAGLEKEWDITVCVWASRRSQEARLRWRGLSRSEARRRMDAQMDGAVKMRRADFVLVNNGTRRLLREQTIRLWRRIEEAGKHAGV